MLILDVVGTAPINGDTTVIVKGDDSTMRNGTGILDDDGNQYKIISVGLTSGLGKEKTTPLLVEGEFASSRIFV